MVRGSVPEYEFPTTGVLKVTSAIPTAVIFEEDPSVLFMTQDPPETQDDLFTAIAQLGTVRVPDNTAVV